MFYTAGIVMHWFYEYKTRMLPWRHFTSRFFVLFRAGRELLSLQYRTPIASVGQTASSEVANDPYSSAARVPAEVLASSHQAEESKLHRHLQSLDDLTRGLPRRVRQIPSSIQPRSHLGDATAALAAGLPSSTLAPSSFRDPLTEAIVLGSLRERAPGSVSGVSSALYGANALRSSLTSSIQRPTSDDVSMHRLLASAGAGGIGDKYVLSHFLSNVGAYQHPSTSSLASLSNSLSAGVARAASSSAHEQDLVVQELLAAAAAGQAPPPRQRSTPLVQPRGSSSLLDNLRDSLQQRLDNESTSRRRQVTETKGIAKFQSKPAAQPSPSSTLTTEKSTASSITAPAGRFEPGQPIRFFNNGGEISVDGRPKHQTAMDVLRDHTIVLKPPKVTKRKHRRTASDKAREEKKRQEEFVDLQARQRSIWDAFTPYEDEAQDGEEGKEEDDAHDDAKDDDVPQDEEETGDAGEEDDAEVKLNSSNTKKESTSQQYDDSNQDSTGDRERTLSAASVLMTLSPRPSNNNKEQQG